MLNIKRFFPLLLLFLAPFAFCQVQEEDLAMLLGGMIKSDKWIIRKEALEEEFIGNVNYENEKYKLFADRAISKRKIKTYELEGNVFLSRKEKDTSISMTAERVSYNQQKDIGFAQGSKRKQVKIVYKTPENTYTLLANKIEFSKQANFFRAVGKVKLSDKTNTLQAQSATFDRQTGIFEALPQRPVFTGNNKDGDYAITADKIFIDTKAQKIKALGQAQGWIASKEEILTEENLKKLKD